VEFNSTVAPARQRSLPDLRGRGFRQRGAAVFAQRNAPCPASHGARYNAATLEIIWQCLTSAGTLALTVEIACAMFVDEPAVLRPLQVLHDIGLGYLRLGQPATELSGGEARRIKLATKLQGSQRRHLVCAGRAAIQHGGRLDIGENYE
jgi:excinuclease ABC subunit A